MNREWKLDPAFGKPFVIQKTNLDNVLDDEFVVFHYWQSRNDIKKTKGKLKDLIKKSKIRYAKDSDWYFAYMIFTEHDLETIDSNAVSEPPK